MWCSAPLPSNGAAYTHSTRRARGAGLSPKKAPWNCDSRNSHPRCVETDFAVDFLHEASFATILAIPESVEDAQDIGISLLSRVRHAFDNLTADTVDLARERLVMRALSGLDDVGDLAEEIATDELYAPGESTPFRTLEAATNASLAEVHDFIQRWLRPKNASVVVATEG